MFSEFDTLARLILGAKHEMSTGCPLFLFMRDLHYILAKNGSMGNGFDTLTRLIPCFRSVYGRASQNK